MHYSFFNDQLLDKRKWKWSAAGICVLLNLLLLHFLWKKIKKKKKSQNSFGSLELHQNYVSVPFKGISDKSLKCFLINV